MSASREFLNIPFDPSASVPAVWSAAQATQLAQLIKECTPAAVDGLLPGLGFVIQSATTPDVATYPEYARFLWLKPVSATVQEVYAYVSGTGWQKISCLATIGAGSVPLTALQVVPGDAGKYLVYDGSGNVVASTLTVPSGTVTPAMIAPAVIGARYMLMSDDVTGLWARVNWLAALNEWISDPTGNFVPASKIKDMDSAAATNQVLYAPGVGQVLAFGNVVDLITNNTLSTQKLNLGGVGNAGKAVYVNATGDDFTYSSAAMVGSTALIVYAPAVGVAADTFSAGVAKVFSWSSPEIDPSSIVTLTGNQITFASTGYYMLELEVGICTAAVGPSQARVYLRKGDGVTQVEVAGTTGGFAITSGDSMQAANLKWLINVTNIADVYDIAVISTVGGSLGRTSASFGGGTGSINYGTANERYQQLKITKVT